jgi:ARG/rhodanese/phosphatase superfamily protein
MPTTFERQSAFQVIGEEALGFKFGNPLRASEKSLAVVLPILRETSIHRQYVTLPEVGENVDIRDTGRIDRFEVKNHTEENLFIRFGTIFKGDTQERALLRSAVILAGGKTDVEVRCVHASRGIRRNAKTQYGGYTPLDLDQRIYTAKFGTERASQPHVWNSVSRISAMYSSLSGRPYARRASTDSDRLFDELRSREPVLGAVQFSDDLAGSLEAFSKDFDDVIRSVEMQPNQAGFALITHTGVETIETFDSPLSWKTIHEDAVKRVGTKLVDQTVASVFEYHPEKAKDAVRSVLAKRFDEKVIWEHKPLNGDPHVRITGLSAEAYTGEVVEIDHRVIHLCLLKTN